MMTESSRKMFILLCTMSLTIGLSQGDTRYYVKMPSNGTNPLRKLMGIDASGIINVQDGTTTNESRSRSRFRIDDETMIRESLKANSERRNSFVESSTFDPDVLNKFLDEYASKMKSTTERNYNFPFRIPKPVVEKLNGEGNDNRDEIMSVDNEKDMSANKSENSVNSTVESNQQDLNDTIKRNKYFGANANDDRNGWVTLDAIPWSKSKISKWQASSSSQRPWPDMKAWEKPSNGKPWTSEFPSRPAYINNEPWNENTKPQRPSYQSERPSPRPQSSTRPSYFEDRFDDNSNQAQKWPPERPQSSWEKFPSADSYRPNIEIITDDRPTNFPNSWDKYVHASTNNNNNNNNNKPSYSYNDRDRYPSSDNYESSNQHQDWPDHHQDNGYPSKFETYNGKPSNFGRPINDHHQNRPQHMSHYEYNREHPQSHPSSGEGQWVLLSTNRGYSKSRQRSIKIDATNSDNGSPETTRSNGTTLPLTLTKQDNDGTIAVMTSKRQVRLTVLPSINGTNTTTSHGGLLEVEKTFKTVDQSQKEYEANKLMPIRPALVNKRPIRNTIGGGRPSNSAVLAAIGAGMLPATMAMLIPIMLGRKKRSASVDLSDDFKNDDYSLELMNGRVMTERRRKSRVPKKGS